MATTTLIGEAEALGATAAADYRDEFGCSPTRGNVGDWDALAWQESWHDLERGGAGEGDHDLYLSLWREGFFGGTAPIGWTSIGCVPYASAAPTAAGAGSRRTFYSRGGGAEFCYRAASWHQGVFRTYGDADGCDDRGRDNGRTYPAAEFES